MLSQKKFDLDIIIGFVAAIVGLLITFFPFLKNFHQEDLGIVVFTSSVLYIILRNRFDYKNNHVIKFDLKSSWIIYLCMFVYNLYLLKNTLYHRPLAYFLTVAIMGSIIAIEIFYTNINEKNIILKIILFSLSLRYGIFYEFPGYGGGDFYLHVAWVENILQNHHLVKEMGRYYDYPLFHISVVTSTILSSFDVKSGYFISTVSFYVVSSIFIYLIGNRIMDKRTALYSMLLLNISDVSILISVITITPGTLVYPLFLIILYFFIASHKNVSTNFLILLLIFFIILTHQLSTLVSFLMIFIVFLSSKIYHPKEQKISSCVVIIFYLTMISQWMYASSESKPFFDYMLNPFRHIFETGNLVSNPTENAIAVFTSQYSFFSNALFHFGFLLLIFFGIVGIFSYISSKNITIDRFIIFSLCFGIFTLIYTVPLTGIGNNAITTRWLIFGYTSLVFPAAFGIFLLTNLFRYKKTVMFFITFWLIFFMVTAPPVNSDSPVYLNDRWPRVFHKESELMAAQKLVDISTIPINLDSSFPIFRNYLELNYRKSTMKGKQLIVARIINEPLSVSSLSAGELSQIKVLDKSYFEKYETEDYYHIFNDGAVNAYYEHT